MIWGSIPNNSTYRTLWEPKGFERISNITSLAYFLDQVCAVPPLLSESFHWLSTYDVFLCIYVTILVSTYLLSIDLLYLSICMLYVCTWFRLRMQADGLMDRCNG